MIRTSVLRWALLCALGLLVFESPCLAQIQFADGDAAQQGSGLSALPRADDLTAPQWRPVRRFRRAIEPASAEIEIIPAPQGSAVMTSPPGETLEQAPPEGFPPGFGQTFNFNGVGPVTSPVYGAGCEGEFCDYMGSYGSYHPGSGYGCPGPLCSFYGWIRSAPWGYWLRNFQFFFGVHGFKGPFDLGRNGNFGCHEGLNFGAPLGDPWGVGYQLGVQGVHSNFSGDRVWSVRNGDRNQVFFTGGLFRRARRQGWQWGVVFDLLRDSYYQKATLGQIRTETSWVTGYGWDLGFWGAYGTREDEDLFTTDESFGRQLIKINDLFAFFYRKHFSGGGEGRLWLGFTGQSGGLVGGDIRVPIGTSWALENDFQYHFPQHGKGDDGQREEAWSVNINFVWYPGRRADQVRCNPFRPLFNVANNSTFMEDVDIRWEGSTVSPP